MTNQRTTPPGVDHKDRIDQLIRRVRLLRSMGASKQEIADHLGQEYTQGDIYLAYVASGILEKDVANAE